MSFLSVASIRQDAWLRARISACAATEGVTYPEDWVSRHSWELAAQPGWAAAWEASTSDTPGTDPEAITDAMILTAVQAILTSGTPPDA